MPIDPIAESLLTFHQVADFLPRRRRGSKIHLSTLYRWTSTGCRGVILESLQVGATRVTSCEALQRFFDRLTHVREIGEVPSSGLRTTTQRQRQSEAAAKELDRLGV